MAKHHETRAIETADAVRDPTATLDILDSISVGVLQVCSQGRVTYVNAYARNLLDFASSPTLGMSLRDFEPFTIRSDGKRFNFDDYPIIKCLKSGQAQPATTMGLRLPDGEIAWVTITAQPVLDPVTGEVQAATATFIDVSHSRQIEEALQQSEARYRRLIEDAPDAIVVHQQGTIVFVNAAAVRLWGGKTQDDFLGSHIMKFVHPKFHDPVRRRVELASGGETTPLFDHLNVRLDGRVVPVESTAMPCIYDGQLCVQAIVRDVTQRKRAQRQSRKQREMLKKFFDRIPLLVAFLDRHDRIRMINRQWRQLVGQRRVGSLEELFATCIPDSEERRLATQYIKSTACTWQDLQVRVLDGRTLDISWANILLSDGTRIIVGHDVTQRRAAERALRQANDLLEQRVEARTEELSKKNRFLQRLLNVHERDRQLVAYEIHDTFVQDIIGALLFLDAFCEVHNEAGDPALETLDQSRRLLRKAIDEARHMISGLRPPIIDEQGIVAAIEYLVNEARRLGVEIHFEHSMSVQRLAPGLEAAIFRIVQEAFTNIERHSQARQATVKLTQSGDSIRLEIADQGVGFDPLSVEEGHFGVQGMRERARLLGADLTIESAPGRGTQIVMQLDRLPEAEN